MLAGLVAGGLVWVGGGLIAVVVPGPVAVVVPGPVAVGPALPPAPAGTVNCSVTGPDVAPVRVTWWSPAGNPVGSCQEKTTLPLASAAFDPRLIGVENTSAVTVSPAAKPDPVKVKAHPAA